MTPLTASLAGEKIEVARRYAAPRARVIAAFQSRSALQTWFAPDRDITVTIPEFEFREGGCFRICYDMPNGDRPVVGGHYTKIALPDELAFTWIWEPPDPHAGIETLVHIRFIEMGDLTEVRLTHQRLQTHEMRARHETGWQQTFDRLISDFDTALAKLETPHA